MTMKPASALLILSLLSAGFSCKVFASTSITSETTGAPNGSTLIQSITVEGDPSGETSKRNSVGTIWNLEYTFDQSNTTDTLTSASILNQSNEFRAGIGQRDHALEYNFTGIYGATPSEALSDFGLEAYLSNDFVFGGKEKKTGSEDSKDTEDSDGTQIFTPKLTLGALRYSDVLSTGKAIRRRGVILPAIQSLNLGQFEAGLKLNYSPWDWLSAKLSGTYYLYSQDVTQFVQVLDNLNAVNARAGAFGSTVSGFPRYEAEFGTTVYFLDSWSLELDIENAQSIYDGSFSQGYKGRLKDELGKHWAVTLGAEEDYSTSGPSTLGYASLEYEF